MTAQRCIVVATITALTIASAAWSADDALVSEIDAMLTAAYPADEPGAAVIVVKDGDTMFRKAYGMANLELDVPLEPDMIFRIGSITKQFSAAAILLLEQEGKLSIQDPITKYLPGYPTHGHTITIEHLLTHTSGIHSYTNTPGYMGNPVRSDLSTEELVEVFADDPMEFAPGERWKYNNSGYVLVGAIIEKVSGQSYAEFLEEHIFDPLEMTSSHYGGPQLIKRRASGYSGTAGDYENAGYVSMTQPHAAGSLLSSVDDLARWDRALTTQDLLTRASYERMTTQYVLNDGEAADYGYGFGLRKLRGRDSVQHGGGIHGFSTFALRIPEERLYVSVLTNIPGRQPSPATVATKIAALTLGEPFADRIAIELPASTLEHYTGSYYFDAEFQLDVSFEEGKLFTQFSGGGPKTEALPESETTFFYESSLTFFEMLVGEDGTVTGMRFHPNGADEGDVHPKVPVEH